MLADLGCEQRGRDSGQRVQRVKAGEHLGRDVDNGVECVPLPPRLRGSFCLGLDESAARLGNGGQVEAAAHEVDGVAEVRCEGDVLEPALDLCPFLGLDGAGSRCVVGERQVLEREDEQWQARAACSLLCQHLEQEDVAVGVSGVAGRGEVLECLAELVEDQQDGGSVTQHGDGIKQALRSRDLPFGARGEGLSDDLRGPLLPPALDGCLQGSVNRCGKRFTTGCGNSAEEAVRGQLVPDAGQPRGVSGAGCRNGRFCFGAASLVVSEEGVEEVGERGLAGAVGAGERPCAGTSEIADGVGDALEDIEGARADVGRVQLALADVTFEVGGSQLRSDQGDAFRELETVGALAGALLGFRRHDQEFSSPNTSSSACWDVFLRALLTAVLASPG